MDEEQEFLSVSDITVAVRRKPIKNMYLRIEKDSLKVVASVPLRMPVSEIERFIYAKKAWLQEKLLFLSKRQAIFTTEKQNIECLWLWGKKYSVSFAEGKQNTVITNDAIIFQRVQAQNSDKISQIDKFYRQQLQQKLECLAVLWQQRLRLMASCWRIRRMKTRWGTCNTGSKAITVNYNLVRLPLACLELIVVHELAHLYEASHNKRFKDFMSLHLPDWQQREDLLKHYTF